MEQIKLNLEKFRGNRSSLFTGRPQGESARQELELDKLDRKDCKVTIIIPKGTTSLNPSFYLGLLFKSIKYLGLTKFDQHYEFEIEDFENAGIRQVILENIEDGKRYAKNSIEGRDSFKSLLNI
jgi:hypothetical protein